MRLIEIDAVDAQALQRGVDRPAQIGWRQALVALSHVHAGLGRDQHLVAPAAARQPLADQALGLAAAIAGHPARIDIGGVDQVAAGIDEGIEQLERAGGIGRPAEDIAAEGDRRHRKPRPAERAKLHGETLPLRGARMRLRPPPGHPRGVLCLSLMRCGV